MSAALAWDWSENVRLGANLFLGKLRRKLQPEITWKHLALAAWAAYNGSGEAAERYAQQLALSEEGALISLGQAAATRVALIEPTPALEPPSPWLANRLSSRSHEPPEPVEHRNPLILDPVALRTSGALRTGKMSGR